MRVIFPGYVSRLSDGSAFPAQCVGTGDPLAPAVARRAGAAVDEAGGLTLRVLGELDAIRDPFALELGGRRQRAVLAALIIARGEVASAERLAECVWGDGAGARHAGGLQSYVSHLRALLQPDSGARSRNDVIARAGIGYALCVGPLAVDAWQFAHTIGTLADCPASERVGRLSDGLGLWRGPGVRGVCGRAVGGDRGRPVDRVADSRTGEPDGRPVDVGRRPLVLAARVLGEFGDDKNRFHDVRARKNYSGQSPITRASGKKTIVMARYATNRRLGDALHQQAFSALTASPGARAYYDALKARKIGHHAALRQLANRLVGILHGCLKTGTKYDETIAWQHQNIAAA